MQDLTRWLVAGGGATLLLACTSARSAPPVRDRAALPTAALAAPGATARCPTPRGDLLTDTRSPSFADPHRTRVEGGLDLALVEREVQRHLPDLEQCFQRRLRAHPELSGRVIMHWGVAPTGDVAEQCVTDDSVGDPEVRACVNALVAATHYPAPIGGTASVSYPFAFNLAPGC